MLKITRRAALFSFGLMAFTSPAKLHACEIYSSELVTWKGARKPQITLSRAAQNLPPPRLFNAATKTLPANYSGIDPYLAWQIITKSQKEKGEYETSRQAEERKDLQVPYKISYGYNTSHALPFVKSYRDLDALFGSELRYNADDQALEYTLETRKPRYRVVINEKSKTEKYVGANAFGVKTVVTKTTGCESAIEFGRPDANSSLYERAYSHQNKFLTSRIKVEIPSSPAQAKHIKKQDLSIIFLLRPSAELPRVGTDYYSREPTIDEPRDVLITTRIIYGNLEGILIFNKKTGQILGSKFFDH